MCATQKNYRQPRVYIAAALFSPSERRLNEDLCALLEVCYSTYLPQRDGTLIEEVTTSSSRIVTSSLCKQVYEQDIEAITGSDILLAVLEGRSLDEGVCVEMRYAKALGKFIVGYKSDIDLPPEN
jgi:nucleoside 2-deoxyribosyltransferase